MTPTGLTLRSLLPPLTMRYGVAALDKHRRKSGGKREEQGNAGEKGVSSSSRDGRHLTSGGRVARSRCSGFIRSGSNSGHSQEQLRSGGVSHQIVEERDARERQLRDRRGIGEGESILRRRRGIQRGTIELAWGQYAIEIY